MLAALAHLRPAFADLRLARAALGPELLSLRLLLRRQEGEDLGSQPGLPDSELRLQVGGALDGGADRRLIDGRGFGRLALRLDRRAQLRDDVLVLLAVLLRQGADLLLLRLAQIEAAERQPAVTHDAAWTGMTAAPAVGATFLGECRSDRLGKRRSDSQSSGDNAEKGKRMNTLHGDLHPQCEGLLSFETMPLWHRRGATVTKEWRRWPATTALQVAAILAMFGATLSAQPTTQGKSPESKRMLDGKQWTTQNLDGTTAPSYCYDNLASNCERYGRLYTWESAQQACRALGGGWRLPTSDEWRELGKRYGGIRQESADLGKAAYTALMSGGSSGFDAVYGGGRTDKSR